LVASAARCYSSRSSTKHHRPPPATDQPIRRDPIVPPTNPHIGRAEERKRDLKFYMKVIDGIDANFIRWSGGGGVRKHGYGGIGGNKATAVVAETRPRFPDYS
ncbi:hypothetical protein LINPERHAP1_LOCUS41013, partial [Linum perenne]